MDAGRGAKDAGAASAAEMAALDAAAAATGWQPEHLVDLAAEALHRALRADLLAAERPLPAAGPGFDTGATSATGHRATSRGIVILCGKGNNAADGAALARRLVAAGGEGALADGPARLGGPLVLVLAAPAREGSPLAYHLRLLALHGIAPLRWKEDRAACIAAIRGADLVIDALAGTGLTGALEGELAEIVLEANRAQAEDPGRLSVAIDLPAGLHEGYRPGMAAFRADLTLAVELPKKALYLPAARPSAGRIRVVRGVFPPAILDARSPACALLDEAWLRRAIAAHAPSPASHKGSRGSLAVFAGGDRYPGAAWLAAEAAARAGAGLVSLWLEPALYAGARPAPGAIIARDLRATLAPGADPRAFVASLAEKAGAFLIGPGMEGGPDAALLLEALAASGKPLCVDAGALRLLADAPRASTAVDCPARSGGPCATLAFGGRAVLTPHPGEASALLARPIADILAEPEGAARDLARGRSAVVVLKGPVTWISDGTRLAVVDGMNPMMASGGTGDVLAGIIAGLLARGIDPFGAARMGAAIHQVAGRICAAAAGYFLAEELAREAGRVAAGTWSGGDELWA